MNERPDLGRTAARPDDLWQDERHWRWKIIYACKDDPRTIVRNRWLFGWTWNFGHPRVFLTMGYVALIMMMPAGIAVVLGWPALAILAIGSASVVVVLRLAHRIASRE